MVTSKGKRRSNFMSYEEAKKTVALMGIHNKDEYIVRYKEIPGLPSGPREIFIRLGEWKGWGEFLPADRKRLDEGVPCLRKIPVVPYKQACKIVRSLGIKTFTEFRRLARVVRAKGVTTTPWLHYKEWKSFPAFFGTESSK